MLDHPIGEQLTASVAHELMHTGDNVAGVIHVRIAYLDVGVDLGPLSSPVLTHAWDANDPAALERVWPVDVRREPRDGAVDIAGVERPIDLVKEPKVPWFD